MRKISNRIPLVEPSVRGLLLESGNGPTADPRLAMVIAAWTIALSYTDADVGDWPKKPTVTQDESFGRTLLVPWEWDMAAAEKGAQCRGDGGSHAFAAAGTEKES